MDLDKLRNAARRGLVHDASINLKVPHEVKETLEDIAREEEVTASTVVRWAIADFLKKREAEGG